MNIILTKYPTHEINIVQAITLNEYYIQLLRMSKHNYE